MAKLLNVLKLAQNFFSELKQDRTLRSNVEEYEKKIQEERDRITARYEQLKTQRAKEAVDFEAYRSDIQDKHNDFLLKCREILNAVVNKILIRKNFDDKDDSLYCMFLKYLDVISFAHDSEDIDEPEYKLDEVFSHSLLLWFSSHYASLKLPNLMPVVLTVMVDKHFSSKKINQNTIRQIVRDEKESQGEDTRKSASNTESDKSSKENGSKISANAGVKNKTSDNTECSNVPFEGTGPPGYPAGYNPPHEIPEVILWLKKIPKLYSTQHSPENHDGPHRHCIICRIIIRNQVLVMRTNRNDKSAKFTALDYECYGQHNSHCKECAKVEQDPTFQGRPMTPPEYHGKTAHVNNQPTDPTLCRMTHPNCKGCVQKLATYYVQHPQHKPDGNHYGQHTDQYECYRCDDVHYGLKKGLFRSYILPQPILTKPSDEDTKKTQGSEHTKITSKSRNEDSSSEIQSTSETDKDDKESVRRKKKRSPSSPPHNRKCICCSMDLCPEAVVQCMKCTQMTCCIDCYHVGVHPHHGNYLYLQDVHSGQSIRLPAVTNNTQQPPQAHDQSMHIDPTIQDPSNNSGHQPQQTPPPHQPFLPPQQPPMQPQPPPPPPPPVRPQGNLNSSTVTQQVPPTDPTSSMGSSNTKYKSIYDPIHLNKLCAAITKFTPYVDKNKDIRTFPMFLCEIELLADSAIEQANPHKDALMSQILLNRLATSVIHYIFDNTTEDQRKSYNELKSILIKQYARSEVSGTLEAQLNAISQGKATCQQLKAKITSLSNTWIQKLHDERNQYPPRSLQRQAILESKRRSTFIAALRSEIREKLFDQLNSQTMDFDEVADLADTVEQSMEARKNYQSKQDDVGIVSIQSSSLSSDQSKSPKKANKPKLKPIQERLQNLSLADINTSDNTTTPRGTRDYNNSGKTNTRTFQSNFRGNFRNSNKQQQSQGRPNFNNNFRGNTQRYFNNSARSSNGNNQGPQRNFRNSNPYNNQSNRSVQQRPSFSPRFGQNSFRNAFQQRQQSRRNYDGEYVPRFRQNMQRRFNNNTFQPSRGGRNTGPIRAPQGNVNNYNAPTGYRDQTRFQQPQYYIPQHNYIPQYNPNEPNNYTQNTQTNTSGNQQQYVYANQLNQPQPQQQGNIPPQQLNYTEGHPNQIQQQQ